MRWLAPLVVVGLLAAGVARPPRAEALPQAPQLHAAGVANKLAPPRAAIARGTLAERRWHADQSFVVEPAFAIAAPATYTMVATTEVFHDEPVPRRVVPEARGPPARASASSHLSC